MVRVAPGGSVFDPPTIESSPFMIVIAGLEFKIAKAIFPVGN